MNRDANAFDSEWLSALSAVTRIRSDC